MVHQLVVASPETPKTFNCKRDCMSVVRVFCAPRGLRWRTRDTFIAEVGRRMRVVQMTQPGSIAELPRRKRYDPCGDHGYPRKSRCLDCVLDGEPLKYPKHGMYQRIMSCAPARGQTRARRVRTSCVPQHGRPAVIQGSIPRSLSSVCTNAGGGMTYPCFSGEARRYAWSHVLECFRGGPWPYGFDTLKGSPVSGDGPPAWLPGRQ